MERRYAPTTAPERESLIGWLDHQRDTLAMKCDGLDADQLCERSVPPSSMSLIGLVRHMADVERSWFQRFVDARTDAGPIFYSAENRDGDFDDVDPATVDADLARWRAECAVSDEIVAATDLDTVRHSERWGNDISVRWVLNHMIEEYARHNGHADLLRECIDGTTGE